MYRNISHPKVFDGWPHEDHAEQNLQRQFKPGAESLMTDGPELVSTTDIPAARWPNVTD